MDYLFIAIGSILILLGFVGCFLPVLPGPPLSYAGLLFGHFTRWGGFETSILVWLGIAAMLAAILDYILPIWTTKKFGGSNRGVIGATVGLILGAIFFSPFGIIIGPFVGAFLGEFSVPENRDRALKSAFGSFMGFVLGTGLKLASVGAIAYSLSQGYFSVRG